MDGACGWAHIGIKGEGGSGLVQAAGLQCSDAS